MAVTGEEVSGREPTQKEVEQRVVQTERLGGSKRGISMVVNLAE